MNDSRQVSREPARVAIPFNICFSGGLSLSAVALLTCKRVYKSTIPWSATLLLPLRDPGLRLSSIKPVLSRYRDKLEVYAYCREAKCRNLELELLLTLNITRVKKLIRREGVLYLAGEATLIDLRREIASARLVLGHAPRGAKAVQVSGPRTVLAYVHLPEKLDGVVVLDEPELMLIPYERGSSYALAIAAHAEALDKVNLKDVDAYVEVGGGDSRERCRVEVDRNRVVLDTCDPALALSAIVVDRAKIADMPSTRLARLSWVLS
jgi:hypothetical protein